MDEIYKQAFAEALEVLQNTVPPKQPIREPTKGL